MQDTTVNKLFNEQLEYYSRENHSSSSSPLIHLFSVWVNKNKIKKKLAIAEFGGSAGQLLKAINHQYPNSTLTNIEIVAAYKQKQFSKKIKFIHGSILNSKIANQSFDVLIIRDILHHLIGKDLRETRKNQVHAIKELKRLIKPGGIILIEEQVNQSDFVCKLIYYLSNLNSKIGLRIPQFNISPNTIICLLTPQILNSFFSKSFNRNQILKTEFVKTTTNWRGKLIHLGAPYGKLRVLIQE